VRRIVIDTNVFVAAGFNPRSAAARVLAAVREGRYQLIWNEPTRRETEMILRQIPHLDWKRVADLFQPEAEFLGSVDPDSFVFISGHRGSEIRSAERCGANATRHQRQPPSIP
jgi:predicted nucleic acid-binding protein